MLILQILFISLVIVILEIVKEEFIWVSSWEICSIFLDLILRELGLGMINIQGQLIFTGMEHQQEVLLELFFS